MQSGTEINRAAEESSQLLARTYSRYRADRRKRTWIVLLTQTAILIACVGLWELAGRMKWIDVLLFSYPSKVWEQIVQDFADGSIWPHLGMTVGETVAGFVLGTLFGTLLAVVIWRSDFLARVLDPYMVVFNSMPKVALGPLFIVGFGAGFAAIVATTLSITVIITTIVVYNSFREVDPNYIKVVRVFGGGKSVIFSKVILPASFPAIVSTLKVNVGLAWVGVIVGEFLVSKIGLGYLIIYGFQVFNFTLVMASLVIIAVVATLMYQGVAYLERAWLNRS
ncbi:ABC transporter permease [Paenibacillus thiaminolyticus]|uniref:ABC transporter permease n=1 Tax=Paenibacillus thiaminolyticus TaxID=49283 RepID=A0AAP9DRL8_PANTH|nr:ABC transporter permease [Paenibacillus thiaminolyticus]MCY9535804.1 ABC transporter permease [Paenibacillus thiaminolyticus]MCY9605419.1 ABC transporter permease [Paenibacillus thiaminolyticus]MCY9608616.1 ABC transporter permease [Paenibacillus thiaminolyticus]MCY9613362.1 ABC transporter permease [Paenibacillus thiaminolyticus]MCY9619536.1 ABC transporter permease [Paenibacillus thiaminolyticus]